MNILHILPRITGGGPARALIALVKAQAALGLPYRHSLLALKREAYPPTLLQAKHAGMEISREPNHATLVHHVETADIVTLHFWNTPELYAALQTPFPPMRLVVWSNILGDSPPQVLTESLTAYADRFMATDGASLALAALQPAVHAGRAGVIPAVPDFERLAGVRPRPHDTFNVGYIGTLNANKLHPDFIEMSAAVGVPNLNVVVCGGIEPVLQAQADALGVSERFQFLGYVEDIASVLETLDVFGYPLAPDNYSTTDLALQEAMYVGVPPVVFPHGGAANLVRHDETGLIVHDRAEYKQAIEYLYAHPAERKRLGDNARAFVRTQLSGAHVGRAFDAVFMDAMQEPRRVRPPLFGGYNPGQLFAATLGEPAPCFHASLTGSDADAEAQIANAPTALAMGEGGIFHYRNAYPRDPFLRFWSGLVLDRQGRRELAVKEFHAALDLGFLPHASTRISIDTPITGGHLQAFFGIPDNL